MSLIIPNAYAADENTISFNGHKYHIFAISMTWSEAKKYCENSMLIETKKELVIIQLQLIIEMETK